MLELQQMYEKLKLFENMTESEIKALHPTVKNYNKGEFIVYEGDSVQAIGLILSGRIQVFSTFEDGSKNIILSGSEGFLFGESLAILNIPTYPVSVIAEEKTRILFLSKTVLKNACHTFLLNLMRITALSNINYRNDITMLKQKTTRAKIMFFLKNEAKKNKSDSFTIEYDRQGLADYLGVERSAMSAELGKLVKDGFIKTRKNHFEIIRISSDKI